MKKIIKVETLQKSWSLVSNITYATVPYWYNATFRDLKASIVMPKFREPEVRYPLLIWICGGAFKVEDKDVWWPQWVDFARKGVVIASIDYRTSNDSVFPAALYDVKAAVRYFKKNAEKFAIDPECVFIAGESAGGALASLAGVTGDEEEYEEEGEPYKSNVQGVIDFYGVVDMTARTVSNKNNITAGAQEQLIGVEGNKEELLKEASAVAHIKHTTPPFLIFHGTDDDLVSIEQSNKLYNILCENGVYAEYFILENEGHGADAFYQTEILNIVSEFMNTVRSGDSE